jgi:unsaturated rhamnogalacturonyl hydrolase
MWAFGEAIVLEGLLAAAEATGRGDFFGFVHGLGRASLGRGVGRAPEDHVAPGRVFLTLHERLGDRAFLDAALALAELHRTFPTNRAGARMPRSHVPGWRAQIWVDSMDVAPPFLAHLARVVADDRLYDEAAAELLAYCNLLQQSSGLFRHGYEEQCGPNGQIWARGNGWALLGMVETLSLLPPAHGARAELGQRLETLLEGLERSQRRDGLWHTIVDDPASYEESTLAALVAAGVPRARAASLPLPAGAEAMAARARAAVLALLDAEGGLRKVSDATPIGERAMYATRPFGIFPWGQGPLLLMVCQQ